MTQQTSTETQTEIIVVTNPDSLWGNDPEAESTYDQDASADRFDELLADAIQEMYPGAAVTVEHRSVYDNEIRIRMTPDESLKTNPDWNVIDARAREAEAMEEQILNLIADVHQGRSGDWAIER